MIKKRECSMIYGLIAILLAFVLVFAALPITASAETTNSSITNPDTTVYDFEDKTGLYRTISVSNGITGYTETPDGSSKYCAYLKSLGYGGAGVELAAEGFATTKPYVMTPLTTYTVTFKFKIDSAAYNRRLLVLYAASKYDYDTSTPKIALASMNLTNNTDYDSWQTFTATFTTSENQYYNEFYTNSSYTHVCDKLDISFSCGESSNRETGGTIYIDDIVITNHDKEETYPDKQVYEINDFTHEPYSQCYFGKDFYDARVAGSMYSTTDGENSVLAYQYALHPQHVSLGFSSSGEGTRGNFMGTEADSVSATLLVTSDGKPIELVPGYAYKISFKYNVTSILTDSYIGFAVVRGKTTTSWTPNVAVTTSGVVNFTVEHQPTNEWKETYYTFFANDINNEEYKYLKFGMVGYGTCLVDDIKVEIIDRSQVEILPDTADFSYTKNSGKATITAYNGKATELVIPSLFGGSVLETIGAGSFIHCKTIESISLPYGLKTIEAHAFEKTYALKTISISETVENIGEMVFYDTPALTEITVDANNPKFVALDGVLYTVDMKTLIKYPTAKTATSFTVPSTVTEIAPAAFQGAENLTSIVLPQGLVKIGERAFLGCTKLGCVSIPNNVTELGDSAFRNCTALSSVEMSDTLDIGTNAFYGCDSYYTFGNIDSEGAINASDAARLAKALVKKDGVKLSYQEKLSADVNRDGSVDTLDAVILKRHIAGWEGYEELPNKGRTTETYNEYVSNSENAELVLNLTNNKSNYISSNRDINYDSEKEDVIMVLVIGQSNNCTDVGYSTEYDAFVKEYGKEPTKPTRPDEATVYSGTVVTELTSADDAYYLCDTEAMGKKTLGSSIPALGKALHDATGARIVFIRAAKGATSMSEWVKDPENYVNQGEPGGKGVLYSNAVRNYLKSYYALKENYNIISTGYYWCQGENEESLPSNTLATVHDAQSYYDAFTSMHETITADCELDYGSIFMPRSYYKYNKDWSSSIQGTEAEKAFDTVERSRCTTIARQGMYRAANEISNLFVVSNHAETMKYGDDDISSTIHYAQQTYNAIGAQAAKTLLSYLDIEKAPTFTGIRVYNSQGVELAEFDMKGNLISGSRTVDVTNEDNHELHVAIEPLGTYYSYKIGYSNSESFSSEFLEIDPAKLSAKGYTSFDIIVNIPSK